KNIMYKKYLLLLLIAFRLTVSCKKYNDTYVPPPPVDPAQTVLLKDIVIPNLPSPYYHFEYNSAGKPSVASFASSLFAYNLIYSGEKVSEMQSLTVNSDRLQFVYDNSGRAILINYFNAGGVIHKKLHLTYNGQKLISTVRERILGADFVVDKTM